MKRKEREIYGCGLLTCGMGIEMDEDLLIARCEWGKPGIEALWEETDVFIIVDVLSFTTSVDIAVSRGARVYPYRWRDFRSAEFAQSIGGVMAVSSRMPGFSLSPSSLLSIPGGTRLVLPSPNGSTLSLETGEKPTLAGCLRNAAAVANAARSLGRRVSVIPGGERWPDGSLRPAIEDWLGAGAIIAALGGERTPEAESARLVFEEARGRLGWFLEQCTSGRELAEKGRLEDVLLAEQLNVSSTAPILRDGAFTI